MIEDQLEAKERGESDVWTFTEVLAHQGPLNSNDPCYKGSAYNVEVLWETGEKTWEPLNMMIRSDPVTLAVHAKKNDLLETPGWKTLKRAARRAKQLQRMVNASKRKLETGSVRYKFGVQVPRNVSEAMKLDAENKNDPWKEAMKVEIAQLEECGTFRGIGCGQPAPEGYKMIPARMVFDVKQSLKRKARFVAGGHKTDPPKDSTYSSVASLRSVRLVALIAELNGLKLTAGDVGNAHLEATTSERVAFVAGPEFGELEGHTMVVVKALCGLRSSGARFHEKFAETLRSLNFYSIARRSRCLDS